MAGIYPAHRWLKPLVLTSKYTKQLSETISRYMYSDGGYSAFTYFTESFSLNSSKTTERV